jgi:hypothetical protein
LPHAQGVAKLEGFADEREDIMLQVVEHAEKILQQLSELEDEWAIGRFLEAEKVHGRRKSPKDCVLARFLQRETGATSVDVRTTETTIGGTVLPNPLSVQLFVVFFDAGKFLLLETSNFLRHFGPEIEITEELEPGQVITVSGSMIPYLRPWLTGERSGPKRITLHQARIERRRQQGKYEATFVGRGV